MVTLTSLWLPILLSAVGVFVLSSVLHMVLRYHRADYGKAPSEDDLMDAIRRLGIPPGDYLFPCPGPDQKGNEPEHVARWKKGPAGMMTIFDPKTPMALTFVSWFAYCLVAGALTAFVAGRSLPPGAAFGSVFPIAAVTAFAGYALALWQDTIWYRRSWATSLRSTFDGLLYAALTAGLLGWLWPA